MSAVTVDGEVDFIGGRHDLSRRNGDVSHVVVGGRMLRKDYVGFPVGKDTVVEHEPCTAGVFFLSRLKDEEERAVQKRFKGEQHLDYSQQ